ncbi:MAG: hypothetical protein PHS93_01290 [Candidatus Omnitrophica bacterium]|nr:hypothetical protein [Candidatus Omnitrophota bacterium]MDD5351787.1 hypothetical protein [Candidatus Omnitrophota bacterium]MDD5550613.1 hypothetical protein [Candidatus Omnitrophota bacterium]
MMDKKAFLLFEATLAIAILSLGLVFLIRSINMSMRVARTYLNYSQAINLAHEKMFEFELKSQADGFKDTSGSGTFTDSPSFSWDYIVSDLPDKNIGRLVLDIAWQERNIKNGFNLATYIKTKE